MIYTEKYRVGLGDLGKDGKITNKAILKMFEDTAGFHSDSVNNGVDEIDANGTAWIIMGWKIKVLDRPGNGEKLTVETWSSGMEKVRATREFILVDEVGVIRALGSSVWAVINIESRRLARIPKELNELYGSEPNLVFEPWKLAKADIPESFERTEECIVRRCDTDIIGHMHNLNYLDLAVETLPEEVYENSSLDELTITYRNEVKVGEKISCGYYKEGDTHCCVIFGNKGEAAIIKMW